MGSGYVVAADSMAGCLGPKGLKERNFLINKAEFDDKSELKITCGLSLLLFDPLFCWFIHDKKLELLLKP